MSRFVIDPTISATVEYLITKVTFEQARGLETTVGAAPNILRFQFPSRIRQIRNIVQQKSKVQSQDLKGLIVPGTQLRTWTLLTVLSLLHTTTNHHHTELFRHWWSYKPSSVIPFGKPLMTPILNLNSVILQTFFQTQLMNKKFKVHFFQREVLLF